jgi:ABC-type methionine transport system permease subunit
VFLSAGVGGGGGCLGSVFYREGHEEHEAFVLFY